MGSACLSPPDIYVQRWGEKVSTDRAVLRCARRCCVAGFQIGQQLTVVNAIGH